MLPPALRARLGLRPSLHAVGRDEASLGWSKRSTSSPAMSLMRTSPCLPPSYRVPTGSAATWSAPARRAELALDIAEAQGLPEPLASALRAKGAVAFSRGHREEAFALVKHALEVALEHDLSAHASTCYFLLSDSCFRRDRYTDALAYLDQSLALARKLGSRPYEWGALAERTYPALHGGPLERGVGNLR